MDPTGSILRLEVVRTWRSESVLNEELHSLTINVNSRRKLQALWMAFNLEVQAIFTDPKRVTTGKVTKQKLMS